VRRFIAARLAQSAIIVVVVTVIAFLLLRLAPGDPFAYDDPGMTPALRAHWQSHFGYDKPVGVQLVRYVSSVAQGDFGYSTTQRRPVRAVIAEALPRTLTLAGIGLALAMIAGVAVGVFTAAKQGTVWDRVISTISVVVYSIPDFWLALIIQLGLAYWLRLFPVSGMGDPLIASYGSTSQVIADRLYHMVLPVLAMTILIAVIVSRFQRAALIDVLPSDYLRTARAKGLPERAVIMRHALRNALTPTITVLGLLIPTILGGTFFVEYIFNWPGLGLQTVNAVMALDYDVATASVIISGTLVAAGSLLADILTALADPRVRHA
jgi:peptide/nickel transport system permease protein